MRVCSICRETSNFDGPMCFWCEREQTDGEMFQQGMGHGVFMTPTYSEDSDTPLKVFGTKRAAEKVAETKFQLNGSQYYTDEAYDQEAE